MNLRSAPEARNVFEKVADSPDLVEVFEDTGQLPVQRSGTKWQGKNLEVTARSSGAATMPVSVVAGAGSPIQRIHLRWQVTPPAGSLYLGDHWERSYGDLAWRSMEPERVMPWYFLVSDSKTTYGCGVKTGASALCFWQLDSDGVSLWLDVRNGGRGVKLKGRELVAAHIITRAYTDVSPFGAAVQFCRHMCEKPRLPASPVYGGNNWYYAYGKSSAGDILEDSKRIASFAEGNANRPFMVIDDGWSPNATAGPWDRGNEKFPDMTRLAKDIQQAAVQPGIWVRPLFTKEKVDPHWQLESPNAKRELGRRGAFTLDPSVPEVLEEIRQEVRTVTGWGYRLVKHDFSTYDVLGRWGFTMGPQVTDEGWGFADPSLTSAEIIRRFYGALREAAGDAMLLGCNTIGHLGAGIFELQRTGDDTSGRDWNRTRKMGVNTLAFRAPQHNTFFAIDADCVGLTRQVHWARNRQWLDLLARSGTPLFVSASPDAVGPEQIDALRKAFQLAAVPRETGEPLDWTTNSEPEQWSFNGERVKYDWFGREGTSPFVG